jgi:hypothetical protein
MQETTEKSFEAMEAEERFQKELKKRLVVFGNNLQVSHPPSPSLPPSLPLPPSLSLPPCMCAVCMCVCGWVCLLCGVRAKD